MFIDQDGSKFLQPVKGRNINITLLRSFILRERQEL